jgi:hypothetical protein
VLIGSFGSSKIFLPKRIASKELLTLIKMEVLYLGKILSPYFQLRSNQEVIKVSIASVLKGGSTACRYSNSSYGCTSPHCDFPISPVDE